MHTESTPAESGGAYWTLADMLGPTDAARALQLKQFEAADRLSDVWTDLSSRFDGFEAIKVQPEYLAALAAYEETVTQLQAMLGEDAHCNFVDSDLWSTFSDCYKDDAGFRPRMPMARADVLTYLERRASR